MYHGTFELLTDALFAVETKGLYEMCFALKYERIFEWNGKKCRGNFDDECLKNHEELA